MKELLEKLEREPESHKGENGKLGVIAGSVDYTGAPSLTSKAALRSGCDLVKILTSNTVRDVVAGYSENFIVEGYGSKYFGEASVDQAESLEDWADCMVVGPGIGCARQDLLQDFIESASKPMVIDAEAIQVAARSDLSNVVLTPHKGEVKLIERKYGSIEEFVDTKEDVVVLLKGKVDKIYSEEGVESVESGHPTMTVGGTGDVLAGVVASLLSQGMGKADAAKLGAWINSKAGEKAAEEYGYGALATDIIEKVPEVLNN